MKKYSYGSKGFITHYHYRDDQKLYQGIYYVRIFTCNFHSYQTKLSIPWYTKMKDTRNQPRNARVLIVSTPKFWDHTTTG